MPARQRLDIQVLRALAVGTVVVFHLWPTFLPGGYIGVDVFFVISGFLISGHIYSEVSKGNGFSFRKFYARRIRRLLPAASLVLLVTLIATYFIAPWRMWANTSSQVVASSLGFQNWLLAFNSTDYFSSTSVPSPVMHYWSLSLEEQFYLFWPFLMLCIWKVSSKFSKSLRTSIAIICLLATLSLLFSIYQTETLQTFAYFNTFTHVWEFLLGALLAFVNANKNLLKITNLWNAGFAILGFGLIIYSAISFDSETKFPGYIATIPVIGTLLVIFSGSHSDQMKYLPVVVTFPLKWLGNNSYSIYLWHWPPIVLAPFLIGHNLGNRAKFVILAGTLLLAWLTTKFVETPIRTGNLSRSNAKTYIFGSITVSLILFSSFGLSLVAQATENKSIRDAQQLIDEKVKSGDECFGAAALSNLEKCPDSFVPATNFGPDFAANDWGTLSGTRRDGTLLETANCNNFSPINDPMWRCLLGSPDGIKTMAVVGDSHALALLEPLVLLANKNGYKVEAFLQNSCSPLLPSSQSSQESNICDLWRSTVADEVANNGQISMVVATGFSRVRNIATLELSKEQLISQYASLYEMWEKSGKQVFVIEDIPLTSGQNVPECVGIAGNTNDPCSVDRNKALSFDPVKHAVRELQSSNVHLIELTDQFCDEKVCHSVIGGLIAYRDSHHVSGTYALTLLPSIEKQLHFR